jgi:penicillin amidase
MEAWAWGKLHTLTLKHPMGEVDALNKIFKLNRGPYAVGGSFHTVSPYTFTLFETDSVYHGSSHRNIYDFSDWDNTISVIPTGMSGIPSSEHYCDQTEMYIQGIYHPDYFSKEAVKENKLYSMEFRP